MSGPAARGGAGEVGGRGGAVALLGHLLLDELGWSPPRTTENVQSLFSTNDTGTVTAMTMRWAQ